MPDDVSESTEESATTDEPLDSNALAVASAIADEKKHMQPLSPNVNDVKVRSWIAIFQLHVYVYIIYNICIYIYKVTMMIVMLVTKTVVAANHAETVFCPHR